MNNYVSKIQDSVKAMRGLSDAFKQFAATHTKDVPKKADKPGTLKGKKKTQKGAIHKVNPTFHSRQILAVTPAQYRRRHMSNTYKAMKKMVVDHFVKV